MRRKHIPQRICVVCREPRQKRELVRVVRTPAGDVQIDLTGKKAGRGAYLCRAQSCWELAFKKRSLEHALQTQIGAEDKAALVEFGKTMPESSKVKDTAAVTLDEPGAGDAV
ncbi:MAG: YlxR family protein [Chloroflexi bacterium]|nr:YlxR family protein [Chloroflexota bacterium]